MSNKSLASKQASKQASKRYTIHITDGRSPDEECRWLAGATALPTNGFSFSLRLNNNE